ncbi:MAG TPA: menaquinone biosynthesis protein [Blastocatellia bacterium]
MNKPYVAASSYLNTAPLCYSFIHGRQRDRCSFLSDAAPSRCADLLADGTADAALIPVIEYQRIPGLRVARGACVSSRSSVRSVVLASKVPIDRIRRVTLDISSRTSAALVRIILSEFYRISPEYDVASPRIDRMLESSDAALIIGDPAMLIDRSALQVYDLAEEWRKHTGLPFVFAFWAIRDNARNWPGKASTDAIDFEAAKREGLENLLNIVEAYSKTLGLPAPDLTTYLTQNICFDLEPDCFDAIGLYYRLAYKAKLIDGLNELRFED